MKFWYQQDTWPAAILNPLSWVYRFFIAARRLLYRYNIFKVHKLSVKIIVVGNIAVGGTGKTPVVAALANYFKTQGFRVGLVSRGYGGQAKQWPQVVTKKSDTKLVGDEPVMLVQQTDLPMVVGPDRVKAAEKLIADYDVNLVISDDGLQHYALGRDVEVIVMDGVRRYGNGSVFPAGPLREPKSRGSDCDFVLIKQHGDAVLAADEVGFKLTPSQPYQISSGRSGDLKLPAGQKIHALAAIGFPEQFFKVLREQGFEVLPHVFPDHYYFKAEDIYFDDGLPVVMTEKGAVKCQEFADEHHWALPVEAKLSSEFLAKLKARISSS